MTNSGAAETALVLFLQATLTPSLPCSSAAVVIPSSKRFELIEEEVAQHRLGAHPLRLSVKA